MMRFLDLMIWKCSFWLMLKTWQSQFFGKNRGTQALVEITTSPRELRRKPAPINVALGYGRLRRGIIILPNIVPYKTQTFSELFSSDRKGFMKLTSAYHAFMFQGYHSSHFRPLLCAETHEKRPHQP